MTRLTLGLALATALLAPALALAQPIPPAPTTPAATTAPKRNAKRVQGKVSAMDTAKRTLTVTTRRDPVGVTVTLTPDAKIYVQRPATLADVKTADKVTVYGKDITAGATTLDATRLLIQPTAAAGTGKKKPGANAGYRKTSVDGAVASTTPTLTITTPGGVTVTVKTAADTKVARTVTGTLSDITVGTTVQARTSGDAAAPTATEVRVMPTNRNAKGRAGGRKRARTGAETPAVPATPAAP